MAQRRPMTSSQRPVSSDATIMSTVIGRNTRAMRYPLSPTTSKRYSAVKKKIAKVAK